MATETLTIHWKEADRRFAVSHNLEAGGTDRVFSYDRHGEPINIPF